MDGCWDRESRRRRLWLLQTCCSTSILVSGGPPNTILNHSRLLGRLLMIEIPELGDDSHAMWKLLIEMQADLDVKWTLIGAQMVQLHGFRLRRTPTRPSRDADVLVECRLVAGTKLVSAWLLERGLELDGMSPDGIGHRFVLGNVSIDVLAPDHLGERASLVTLPPARTVQVPGGRRALASSCDFDVRSRNKTGIIPAPSLAGALVAKARAVVVDDLPKAQRRDLAFLLSLASLEMSEVLQDLDDRDRYHIGSRSEFDDPSQPFWDACGELADDAWIAYRRIIANH